MWMSVGPWHRFLFRSLDCGHSFSNDSIQHASAGRLNQWKLNTPTVGVFPGGLGCLAARRCGTRLDRPGPPRNASVSSHPSFNNTSTC